MCTAYLISLKMTYTVVYDTTDGKEDAVVLEAENELEMYMLVTELHNFLRIKFYIEC